MDRSIEEQQKEYSGRRFLAMPLAGSLVWLCIGTAGIFLPLQWAALVLFMGAGAIVYLGMFISKFTGEDFLNKDKPKNTFDILFLQTAAMALLVFSIAIPFFLVEPTSLPLSVGVLTGLMWLPLSWAIKHWVGIFHAVVRTVLILAVWYLMPEHRYVAVPFAIVAVYLVTMTILEIRWRKTQAA